MAVQPQSNAAVAADLVYMDDLTGLRNRRFLYQVFGEGWGEVTESGSDLSLAIVDLDYFKQVNDTHGHLTGDLVLAETARLIQESLGEEDHAIRYGGDEFVLLLPNRTKTESRELVEGLRRAMAGKEFVSKEESQPLEMVLSFSIGVATFPEDGSSGEQLIAAADKALYASKRAGRNRVTLSGELPAGLEDEIDRFRTFPCKTLVGRQEFIEALGGLCELLELGTGTWTSLSGPAGIGKTRLLHEALRLGLDSSISVVVTNLSEDEAEQPYSTMARLLSGIGARFPDLLTEILQDAHPALLTFLRAHAPELVAPLTEGAVSESTHTPEAVQVHLLGVLRDLCKRHKWLFLLDEVPYLDPHSAELLRAIVEVERLPVGIVSAHRTGDAEVATQPGVVFLESLDRKPWLDRRQVGPLTQESLEVMVSVLLPNHHAPADFSDLLFEITGGNPLFIEELLRIGIARGAITRRGDEWFIQTIERSDLPATLAEAVAERMSFLDDEIGMGISRAAAIGTSITPELLQALLGKNEGEILDFLDKARDQGFVEGGQEGDLSTVRFASSIFRDQAYEQMTDVDRTRTHREIGKIEEHRAGSLVGALSSRLAYHFERGKVYEKARAYLEEARSTVPPIIVAGTWDAAEVPKHRRRRITGAAIPLSEEAWPSLDDVLRSIAQATKSLWMYPEGSPIADAAFKELHQQLDRVFEHAEILSLAAVEDTLVVNGVPYPAKRQQFLVRGILDQINHRQIRGFTIRRGMTEAEVAFLIAQLAADDPMARDPEAWEALLDEKGIENVDFGDRVYVPAEGVANAPVSLADGIPQRPSIVRVASAAELEDVSEETDRDQAAESQAADLANPTGGKTLSSEDLKSLLNRLEADASIDAEIQTLVPMVVELLKKLLEAADDGAEVEHRDLAKAVGLHPEEVKTEREMTVEEDEYLRQVRREWNSTEQVGLMAPAEERFEILVEVRDITGARTILRFLRLCQTLDKGDGDLAFEARRSLTRIANGKAVQLLLEDLSARAERPDHDALTLLAEIGNEGGPAFVTFLRETDDLRSRRVVAGLLREMTGEPHQMALDSVTHGDNPVVARRVVSVLDYLSTDMTGDLSRAVTVRNPAVLGEAIRILQRQPRSIQMQVVGSLLDSASPELVCRGVYYLSEWNLEEAKGSLLMLLRESEDFEILAAVAASLARWRLPEAVPILGELLGRKQVMRLVPVFPRGLRREFARALAAIGTPEAWEQLAEFAKDVDPEVRNIARGMPPPAGA